MDVKITLRSGLRRRLLEYYFGHPGAAPYVHELARSLVLDPGNLSREMASLERLSLLLSERRANRKHYRLNRRSALYQHLKASVNRSTRTIPMLEKALGKIPGIQFACLYGPSVSRRHDPYVPLDLLILGRPAAARLADTLRRLERQFGREIHFLVVTRAEFAALRKTGDRRLADFVWAPKIALVPPT
jgi:predicted transcriptional regulator with HTH domain